MAPTAALFPALDVTTDERVIEADNRFEGMVFGKGNRALRDPRMFWHMRNPLQPSWGEPYTQVVARMRAAITDAAVAAGPGGQALVVSHQLPIWIARSDAEGRPLVHDPRRRQCTLCSVTSFTLRDGVVTAVDYAEPVAAPPARRAWSAVQGRHVRLLLIAGPPLVLLAGCGAQGSSDGVGFEGGDGTVTIVPARRASRRPPSPGRPWTGRGLDGGPRREDHRGQRVGVLVRPLPGRGARAGEAARGAGRRRDLHRPQHPRPRRRSRAGVRTGVRPHLPQPLRSGRWLLLGFGQLPPKAIPSTRGHRRRRVVSRPGCSARSTPPR